nr:MAG TPA: hypothetical protein [Caudoviricetes sp.]
MLIASFLVTYEKATGIHGNAQNVRAKDIE